MKITSVSVIVLCIFLLFFNLFYYPVVSDNFDFWHVGKTITVGMSGHIEPDYRNAGYYVFGVMIAELTSLPYEALPKLPLQAVAVIIVSIALLKEVVSRRSYSTLPLMLAMLVFVTKYGNKSYFMYYCHGLGFVLAITLCLTLSLYLKPPSFEKRQALSILIILIVFSLNYISYKMVFFSITIILGVQLVNWLYNFRGRDKSRSQLSLTKLALLSIVFTLAFNQILYQGLIPRLQEASDSPFSGLDKLILSFYNPKATPFDEYYFTYAVGVRNALTIWLALLLLSVLVTLVYLTYKFYRNKELSDGEMITFGFIIASIGIFVIYNFLGQSAFEFLVYSGLIGYVLLYSTAGSSEKHRYLIVTSLFILLALNGYITMESYEDQLGGIRDNNNFEYAIVPANWYVEKVPYDNQNARGSLYTDVFTGGLIAAEVKKAGLANKYYPRIFSEDQMALLLLHDGEGLKNSDDVFFINYRLTYFSTENWKAFNSWSNYRSTLNENPLLNAIYSSGDISCVMGYA
jgi:hypothetical protein